MMYDCPVHKVKMLKPDTCIKRHQVMVKRIGVKYHADYLALPATAKLMYDPKCANCKLGVESK